MNMYIDSEEGDFRKVHLSIQDQIKGKILIANFLLSKLAPHNFFISSYSFFYLITLKLWNIKIFIFHAKSI